MENDGKMAHGNKSAKTTGSLLPCRRCGADPTRFVKHDILTVECPNCVGVGFHNHVRFGCWADSEWNKWAATG